MLIAIDFDGTLAKRVGIPTREDEVVDLKPMKGALDTVKLLQHLKHEVYVFTANKNLYDIEEWLKRNDFPKLMVTNIKQIGTQVYIDDRALRFTNWNDIRKHFS